MLFGEYPFIVKSLNELKVKIKYDCSINYEYKEIKISDDCKDFLKKCLKFNPKERYLLLF